MSLESIYVEAHSQKGMGRANNEDSLSVLGWLNDPYTTDSFSAILKKNDLPELFLLADGVGGHEHGARASRQSILTISKKFDASSPDFNITNGVSAAHTKINLEPRTQMRQMGTTIVGLVLNSHNTLIFNVGDSRAYLLRREKLNLVSIDDVDVTRPKNVITQCIGGGGKIPKTHFTTLQSKKADTFILLSDGVTDYLSDAKIFEILSSSENKKTALLCREAVKAGSDDDASALLINRF